MKNLLKAKHWQLFLFFYGLPLIYQMILIGNIVSNTTENNKPDIETLLNFSKLSPLIVMIPTLLLLCWFWYVGVMLNNKLTEKLKFQTAKFKVYLTITVLYFVTISTCIGIIMNNLSSNINFYKSTGDETNLTMLALFFLLNLFIAFCLLYSSYFVAKTLKTAELDEKVKFRDYISDFFLICMLFPIGIWFIQPRINNLVKE